MKGLILALGSFLFLGLASIPAIRCYGGRKYYRPLLLVFFLSALIYSFLYRLTPYDLFIIPTGWQTEHIFLDFLYGLVILALLFQGFWNTLYAAFLTGFSSGLLIKISSKGSHGVRFEQLLEGYSAEGVLDTILSKRISDLTDGKYIRLRSDGAYELLPKGTFFSRAKIMAQSLLNMPDGG